MITNTKYSMLSFKLVATTILKKKSTRTATAGTIVSIFGAATRGKITAKKCSTVVATKYPTALSTLSTLKDTEDIAAKNICKNTATA